MPDAILEAGVRPIFILNFLYYSFVIESLCLYLHCLSAALLCYTGFQNQSLIPSISCSCSTCCFGLGFQLQNLQDFIKISRALIKDIFLKAHGVVGFRISAMHVVCHCCRSRHAVRRFSRIFAIASTLCCPDAHQ